MTYEEKSTMEKRTSERVVYCPVCGKHLFSAYDKDMRKDREDGYYFYISRDFNYCSKCGTLLDLEEWKRKEEPATAEEELALED